MKVLACLSAFFLFAPLSFGETVLLDFSGKYCPPCRQMEPVVAGLEREGYRIERISDGGFYVAGTQVPDGSQIEHLWVMRLDSSGGRRWDSSYGPDGVTESMFTFSRTHDDGFIIGGVDFTSW